jgi:hypothetical protein
MRRNSAGLRRHASKKNRGQSLRRPRRLGIEPLEARHLLAANFVITEFLADNGGQLLDNYGAASDWVEIHNSGDLAGSLNGYYLTDESDDKTKWPFPDITIPAGGFLLVFASNQDDRDPAQPLHTNFALANDGEYLGLVAPGGQTVVDEYALPVPPQHKNISYGVGEVASEFNYISPGAAAKTVVPTNNAYDAVWSSPSYVPDANWIDGTTGVGFGQTYNGFIVRTYDANITASSPIGTSLDSIEEALEVIGNPAARAAVRAGNYTTVNFVNTGAPPSTGHYAGDVAFPGQTNPTNVNHFATATHAVVNIPTAGDWTFGIRSNEGFLLGVGDFEMRRSGTDGNADDVMQTFNFPAAGNYPLELYHFEGTGDAWLELFAAPGSHTTWSAAAFDLVGDTANGGLAVESDIIGSSGASISQLIGTNVFSQMSGVGSTFYTRIPFTVDTPADFDKLKLRVKYDDAFVAYLNGVEVARRNVTGATAWNSTASSPRFGDIVLTAEEIDITEFLPQLVLGQNLLAIQCLNFSVSDPDALVLPELVAVDVVSTDLGYFNPATPGAPNGVSSLGFVADTEVSIDRGFFNSPIDVTITTATPGAQIRYTLDGTTPNTTQGSIYTGPIHITQTTTLRVAAFKTGYFSSQVGTHTYLFLNDVIQQSPTGTAPPGFPAGTINGQIADYGMDPDIVNSPVWGPQLIPALQALPSLSLVTPPAHLFDPATGIWVNAQGQGLAYERTGSLELLNPPDAAHPFGTSEFQIDMGMRIRGEFSRAGNNPKHGFRLFFRDDIGGELRYPWFGEEGADVFEKMDLRVAQNWNWHFTQPSLYTYTRDVGARDLQGELGEPYTRSRYYHMYINGQYWGISQTEERPDDFYGEGYLGGDEADYDVMKVDDNATVFATAGTAAAWSQFYSILNTLPQAATQTDRYNIYQRLQGLNPDGTRNSAYPVHLDVENLIDFMMIVNIWCSRDSPINPNASQPKNFFAMRDRTGERGWVYFLHDVEWGILVQYVNEDRNGPWGMGSSLSGFNPNWVHQQLMYCDEYRLLFADYVQKYLFNDGPMTPANMLARHQERVDQIQLAIIAESARWGDRLRANLPYTKNDWLAAVNNVKNNFFPQRTGIVLNQFRNTRLFTGGSAPLFPNIDAPLLNQYGGVVNPGFVATLTRPVNSPVGAEIFYTLDGSDPRLVGGAANPQATHAAGPINIPIDAARQLKARIRSGATWSAVIDVTFLPEPFPLRITELHYHPADHAGVADDEDLEFIEVTNTGTQPVSLNGVQITEFATTPYVFADGQTLAPGERLVVARNPAAFQSVYGSGIRIAPDGYGTANLSNAGERIVLMGPLGEVLQDIVFDDVAPWPTAADGGGPSLEIADALGDPADAANWRTSVIPGGSPGHDGLILAGDYDGNLVVDAGDHSQWRVGFGLTVPLGSGADGNGNGVIDAGDYVVWRKNLGASMPAPAASASNAMASVQIDVETPAVQRAETRDYALQTLFAPSARTAFAPSKLKSTLRPVGNPVVEIEFADKLLLLEIATSVPTAVDDVGTDVATSALNDTKLDSAVWDDFLAGDWSGATEFASSAS